MVDTQVAISNYGGTKGQIFDPVTNQIWVGTTTGGIFVMKADTLKTIWHLGGHGSIDQVTFDPKLRIVYAFAGNAKGFDAYDMNTKRPLGFVSTGVPLTHTGDVDLANDDIYAFAGQTNEAFVYKPEPVGQ